MDYIVYFCLYLWCILNGLFFRCILKCQRNKVEFFSIYIPMFLVSAFRSVNVGADTEVYFYKYKQISQQDMISSLDVNHEPGYVVFNKILSLVSSDEQILLVASSLVVIFGIGIFCYKYSKGFYLSTLLFLGLGLYSYYFTPIRQAMSIPFTLWGIYYLYSGSRYNSIIFILLATTFHYSAAVFLLLPFFYPYDMKKTMIIIMGITYVGVLLYYVGGGYLNLLEYTRYAGYASGRYAESVDFGLGVVRVLIFFILGCVSLYVATRNKHDTEKNMQQECYIFSIICFMGALMVFLGYQFFFLARYDISFWPFVCLLIPLIYDYLKHIRNVLVCPIIVIFITIYMWATYSLRDMPEFKYQDIFGLFK